jgi:hypothetical protein
MRAEEEKGGLQGGWRAAAARRLRRDITPHVHSRAHLSLCIRGAHLHTSYLHKRLFHIHPHRTNVIIYRLLQRTQRGAANNIIVLILIEICILFADPHTYLCAAPNKYTIKLPPRWVLRRALFFAPFLLSFRPAQSGCIYFHWPNGM